MPSFILIEQAQKAPMGGCSACPNVVFELAIIGSRDENLLALRQLFEQHFRAVRMADKA
jgi:hypothetical protein